MRRHAADDPDVATILTTAHDDIHRITVAFSAGSISIAHATAAARAGLAASSVTTPS